MNATLPIWMSLLIAALAFTGVLGTVWIQDRNAKRQIRSAHALKVSEMRQDWIHRLREAMATFQSYGVTPQLKHDKQREFYEAGTLIELFMNPNDADYPELSDRLYEFLAASDDLEKFSANREFVQVCQQILKREWDVLKQELKGAAP